MATDMCMQDIRLLPPAFLSIVVAAIGTVHRTNRIAAMTIKQKNVSANRANDATAKAQLNTAVQSLATATHALTAIVLGIIRAANEHLLSFFAAAIDGNASARYPCRHKISTPSDDPKRQMQEKMVEPAEQHWYHDSLTWNNNASSRLTSCRTGTTSISLSQQKNV